MAPPEPSPSRIPRASSGTRPSRSSTSACAPSAETWPARQWSSARRVERRAARPRPRWRRSRRAPPARAAGARRGSRRPSRRSRGRRAGASTSSGSSRWPAWWASAASTAATLRASPASSTPGAAPDPVAPARRRRARRRSRPRRWCCRCPSRRCARQSVPAATASMPKAMVATQAFSSRAGPGGDVAGRQVEGEVEDLEAEAVGGADLVDRRRRRRRSCRASGGSPSAG